MLKSFEFLVNPTVLPMKNCCKTYLFQEFRHILQENNEKMYSFYLIKKKSYEIHAQMCGNLYNSTFYTRQKATFGSISMKKGIDFEVLKGFWEKIEEFLKGIDTKKIIIKHYPSIYDTENSVLLGKILEQKGFLKITELNYILPLENIDFFQKNLHNSNFRHLKKAQKQGFSFEKMLFEQATQVYDFIYAHRTRKGYPMTMQQTDFVQLWADFPNETLVFALKDDEIVVALCVFLAIHKDILYYFYPADNVDYQHLSPMTFLVHCVYEYALEMGFKMIDLGIATENGEPNISLMSYKQHLGGIVGEKITWEK